MALAGIWAAASLQEPELRDRLTGLIKAPWLNDTSGVWDANHPSPGVGLAASAPSRLVTSARHVVGFDGRIHYADDLRLRLGYSRAGQDDSVLLAEALDRWGVDALDSIEGDYACLVWDQHRRVLVGVRSPFALRPLVFTRSEARGVTAFATWPDNLVASRIASKDPDPATVVEYLGNRRTHRGTFFRDVKAVPPGCYVTVSVSGCKTTRFYRPKVVPVPCKAGTAAEEFKQRLVNAVEQRLTAGRTCVHLSGGLDSTGLAYIVQALLPAVENASMCTLSARFPGTAADESEWIAIAAAGLDCPKLDWVAQEDTSEDLDRPILGWPGGRRMMNLGSGEAEAVRRAGGGTILAGLGGDQLTWDLDSLLEAIVEGRTDLVRESALAAGPQNFARRLVGLQSVLGARFRAPGIRAMRAFRNLTAPPPFWLQPGFHKCWQNWTESLPDEMPDVPLGFPTAVMRRLSSVSFLEMLVGLVRLWEERGVQVVLPFLDRRLIDFVISLPVPDRMPRARTRQLHRDALVGLVPNPILARRTKAIFDSTAGPYMARNREAWEKICRGGGPVSAFVDVPQLKSHMDTQARGPLDAFLACRVMWVESWLSRVAAV